MNRLHDSPPTPSPEASIRLRLCVFLFVVNGLASILREIGDTSGLVIHILAFPVLV